MLILDPNEDMSMGKPTLLELDDMHMCDRLAKERVFVKIFEECMQLLIKDSTNNVRSVRSFLARFKSSLNLWPLGIGCDHDKV